MSIPHTLQPSRDRAGIKITNGIAQYKIPRHTNELFTLCREVTECKIDSLDAGEHFRHSNREACTVECPRSVEAVEPLSVAGQQCNAPEISVLHQLCSRSYEQIGLICGTSIF
jgi:hypothetical protein